MGGIIQDFVPLCLVYVFKIHASGSICLNILFLRLHNSPFVWIYYILLVNSSKDMLIPPFACQKYCCYEPGVHIHVCMSPCFEFFCVHTLKWTFWIKQTQKPSLKPQLLPP